LKNEACEPCLLSAVTGRTGEVKKSSACPEKVRKKFHNQKITLRRMGTQQRLEKKRESSREDSRVFVEFLLKQFDGLFQLFIRRISRQSFHLHVRLNADLVDHAAFR